MEIPVRVYSGSNNIRRYRVSSYNDFVDKISSICDKKFEDVNCYWADDETNEWIMFRKEIEFDELLHSYCEKKNTVNIRISEKTRHSIPGEGTNESECESAISLQNFSSLYELTIRIGSVLIGNRKLFNSEETKLPIRELSDFLTSQRRNEILKKGQISLLETPPEIIFSICLFLNWNDISPVTLTCKFFKKTIDREEFFRYAHINQKRYPLLSEKPKKITFRTWYLTSRPEEENIFPKFIFSEYTSFEKVYQKGLVFENLSKDEGKSEEERKYLRQQSYLHLLSVLRKSEFTSDEDVDRKLTSHYFRKYLKLYLKSLLTISRFCFSSGSYEHSIKYSVEYVKTIKSTTANRFRMFSRNPYLYALVMETKSLMMLGRYEEAKVKIRQGMRLKIRNKIPVPELEKVLKLVVVKGRSKIKLKERLMNIHCDFPISNSKKIK